MAEVREPADVRYAKKILELIEKELVEVNGNIMSTEVRLRRLEEQKTYLRNEQKNLLKALGKLESESCCEDPTPTEINVTREWKE